MHTACLLDYDKTIVPVQVYVAEAYHAINVSSKDRPTRSQISAPLKEPMAISKLECAFFAPNVVIVAQISVQNYFCFVVSDLGVS